MYVLYIIMFYGQLYLIINVLSLSFTFIITHANTQKQYRVVFIPIIDYMHGVTKISSILLLGSIMKQFSNLKTIQFPSGVNLGTNV